MTEVADRELLVPDAGPRKQVWRPGANPGTLLVAGELAGYWREKTVRRQLTVRLTEFRPLTRAERAEATDRAEEFGAANGAESVALSSTV